MIKSIIVPPANDEAANIERLDNNLASLKINPEVKWFVVDDNSSERTSQAFRGTILGKSTELLTASTLERSIDGMALSVCSRGVRQGSEKS